MSVKSNLREISKSLENLEKTGIYDVEKYSHSLLHLTSQLEYFWIAHRPKVHQLAYFNIGRGFPKELMDGHWCYILKDMGYKMLVVPCTSLKGTACNPEYEMDIKIKMGKQISNSRIQLSDLRTVDNQRLDLRKPFCDVLTDEKEIKSFIEEHLFK